MLYKKTVLVVVAACLLIVLQHFGMDANFSQDAVLGMLSGQFYICGLTADMFK